MRRMKKWLCMLVLAFCAVGLAACGKGGSGDGGNEAKDVSLEEIHQAVKDAYGESYFPNTELDPSMLESMMGLTSDMYEEIIAEGPMISAQVDTFVAVKAASGKADAVEEGLNGYRDYLINDAMQYPTNAVKVQASQVVRHGDYVFFVLLGEISMETEEQGEDAILKAAQDGVQTGVDAINSFFK